MITDLCWIAASLRDRAGCAAKLAHHQRAASARIIGRARSEEKRRAMAARSKSNGTKTPEKSAEKPIEQYEHTDKQRTNNPPVGLVTPETDRDAGKKTYAYDPHLDPQLVWAGKAEHGSFEVPTVSLHVHERVDPESILAAVKRRNGDAGPAPQSLFAETQPLREAVEFYKHPRGWSTASSRATRCWS
jgi:adenine-specific DNA-methyltransferase